MEEHARNILQTEATQFYKIYANWSAQYFFSALLNKKWRKEIESLCVRKWTRFCNGLRIHVFLAFRWLFSVEEKRLFSGRIWFRDESKGVCVCFFLVFECTYVQGMQKCRYGVTVDIYVCSFSLHLYRVFR